MKKSTKVVSGVLAALMATSAFSTTAFAALPKPTEEQAAAVGEQRIYFQYPTDGTWGDHNNVKVGTNGKGNVYCFIYAVYGNEYKFFDSGWETAVSACDEVDKEKGLYSYNINSKTTVTTNEPELDENGQPKKNARGKIIYKKVTMYRYMEDNPNADYGVIFSTSANGGYQTCDLNMTPDCIGDTVQLSYPIQTRENASNSQKSDYYSEWQNHTQYKTMANITSLGNYVDGQMPAHQPAAQMLSNKLKEYLTNYINVGYFNKPEKNAALCEKIGTTPKAVYDQFMADNEELMVGDIVPANPDEKNATADDSPSDFYWYEGEDDKGQPKMKKLPTPEVVRAALGITEEPTTEEPTTEEPTTEEPTTEEPTTVEPTTEEPTTEEPAPAEDVYVITGGSDWLDGWSPAVDGYVMTKQDDGTYTIDVPDVPAGTANYSLKVVKFVGGDEAQKEWIGVNGTDYNCDFMQTADGDVTVTFVPETKEIKVTGDGVAPAEYPIDKITAVGSGQGGFLYDISWDPDAADNKMDETSEGVYSITFDEVAANAEYQFKFAANGGWGMNWGYVPESEITFGTPIAAQYNANDNIVFTPESENEYVTITLTLDITNWNKVTKEGATYTITVEEIPEPELPIIGDVNGDGKVDTVDATAIQQYSIDLPVDGFNAELADVNGDGRISILDATCVQKYAADYKEGIGNAGQKVAVL